MTATNTRQQIVNAADRLFYEQGFEATSFATISTAVGLSRGNFYYHFKTKDDILDAVIAQRLANTQDMLVQWQNEAGSPMERIRSFTHMLIMNQVKIMKYGCPVGTLCNELAKLDHAAKIDAGKVFTLFQDWLSNQFTVLGRGPQARTLAMHLLMRSQGIATLATVFHDEDFIRHEVLNMDEWLDSLLSPEDLTNSKPA